MSEVNKSESNMKDVNEHTNIQEAFLAAQSEMGKLVKNAKGNYNEYATLAAVTGIVIPALNKHGLALMTFFEGIKDDVPTLVNQISNAAGDHIDQKYPIVCMQRNDPQKFGGAVTYARRYSLMAMVGLAPEDDDGEAASKPGPRPSSQTSTRSVTQSDNRPAQKSAPSASQRVEPTAEAEEPMIKCEIPSCDQFVRASAEDANRALHDGHVICKAHHDNQQTPWQSLHPDYQDGQPAAALSAEEEAELVNTVIEHLGGEEVK